MGKSSKKATAAPVAVVPTKPLKKGKREAEEAVEKAVVKKQKKIIVEEPIKKAPEVKKKIEVSSSEEDDSSSDEDVKAPAAKAAPPVKNGTVKKGKQSSSSSSSDSSDDSEDEAPKSKAAATKNVSAATKKAGSSSEDSSSDDDDDVPAPAAKGGKPVIEKKESSSSDESSDSDAAPPAKTIPKKPSATVNKKVEESSEDSSEEDSEDEKPQKKTKVEPAATVKDSDSEDESSDESSDDEDAKAPVVKKAAVVAKSSSDESSEDESSDEEEEPSKTPLKKSADVEMVDAYPSAKKEEPKTPSTQASGTKTLFVGNLPFSVERSDVESFFQECGEVVDVRFATHADGVFKGFGHVEFATSEAAQKALKDLNGGDLMGRELRLDLANERGAFTPQSGREGASFQKGYGSEKFTAYVRGLDNSADEHDIKTALREHFQGCGEITRISVPTGDNGVKGFAYLDFTSKDALHKAFELNNSTVGDYPVTVEEARPRDNSGGPVRSFNSNTRSGGRFPGRGGRSDGGGRFSNRGRSSNRGRGGDGRPYKPSLATPGTGKKTTFED